jgi:hypothetical protein
VQIRFSTDVKAGLRRFHRHLIGALYMCCWAMYISATSQRVRKALHAANQTCVDGAAVGRNSVCKSRCSVRKSRLVLLVRYRSRNIFHSTRKHFTILSLSSGRILSPRLACVCQGEVPWMYSNCVTSARCHLVSNLLRLIVYLL